MTRPLSITDEDIVRWGKNIDSDPKVPGFVKQNKTVREVCYAGIWLAESLEALGCPLPRIVQLQFTAGRYCFGREPWAATAELLQLYKDDKIVFDDESDAT